MNKKVHQLFFRQICEKCTTNILAAKCEKMYPQLFSQSDALDNFQSGKRRFTTILLYILLYYYTTTILLYYFTTVHYNANFYNCCNTDIDIITANCQALFSNSINCSLWFRARRQASGVKRQASSLKLRLFLNESFNSH